ncbi:MAG: Crp/Fnr family transcriptional regulator [Reichenbachiella sp.]|uniref:Crp/Fnr family transcriptional regulator n=1 Tax=Reichenbachiella sp. TaxID=2184521 RepID=UPI003297CF07
MSISQYIRQFVDPNFDDEQLPFSTKEYTFFKGQVITRCGEVEKKIYFLNSGISYLIVPHNGERRVLDFFFPGDFFCSYTSLLKQVPSDVEILALTESQVLIIDGPELDDIYNTSLLANKLGRVATEHLFLKKVQREKELLTLTAEERYEKMLNKNPAIIAQIPLKIIAQYLGIQPESLSRIRRLIKT